MLTRPRSRRGRQRARVVVRAVADVLEDVAPGGERCLAEPGRALAAHLGEAGGLAVHPVRHEVAADAGHAPCCPRAPWSRCCAGSRGRNRAAATSAGERSGRLLALLELGGGPRTRIVRPRRAIALGHRDARPVRVERAVGREQRCRRARPACREPWRAPALVEDLLEPGSRSGRASPRRPRPARARRTPPAAPRGSSGKVMPTL